MAIAAPDSLNNDKVFNGNIIFQGNVSMKSEALNGNAISSAVPVPVDRVETVRDTTRYVDGTLSTGTNYYMLDVMGQAGNLVYFYAALATAPNTTDTVVIDLEKWNGSSWGTVLSATLEFDSADSDPSATAASIATPAYVNGNMFRVKVVVTGTSAANLIAKAGYVAKGYT